MDTTAICSLCLMLLIPLVIGKDQFIITPEKSKLLVLEGDKLELTCIYDHSGTSERLTFYKNDVEITSGNTDGYEVGMQSSKVFESETSIRDSRVLTKNITAMTDGGMFECRTNGSPIKSTSITVNIFTVNIVDGELPPKDDKTAGPVSVTCEATGVDANVDKNITWSHAGKQLEDGEKYTISDNGTLVVHDPVREDMGEYQCAFVFFPTSDIERHTVKPRPAYVKAGPAIVSHDNSKNMVQGDDLTLKCEVSGYPMPTVTWFKNNVEMNKTTRIHFLDYKGALGILKIYSLEDDDEADYKCFAANDIRPFNASAVMTVRVKDKLAALWPFLGIVAEVVVLCVIILVYEKRRSKKLAEEEDNVDANQENTQDHKDVRHRRT